MVVNQTDESAADSVLHGDNIADLEQKQANHL